MSLGFNEVEYTYYSINKNSEHIQPLNNFGILLNLSFGMDMSSMYHYRSVFTFWDFLGDVGGLNDMLTLLGSWAVSFIQILSGSGLNRYIFARLFKFEHRKRKRGQD